MAPLAEVAFAERPDGRLQDRGAIVTGGDGGIGRAVAVAFAREGADVAILYLDEHHDAEETRALVAEEGRRCVTIAGDIGDERHCAHAVAHAVGELGRLDILVNNAVEQHPLADISQVGADRLERTFRTNVFSMFFMSRAALAHMGGGAAIVNTTSVTAYTGDPALIDYSAAAGAIVAFTRALSAGLAGRGIRVNAVAPGPVRGEDVPLGRPGQPADIAPSYVFLASDDAAHITGQVVHPNGGTIVNG